MAVWKHRLVRVWFVGMAAFVLSTFIEAAEPLAPSKSAAKIDFGRDVFPIFQRACLECHGSKKQAGGLRLDSRTDALRGGDSGPAIIAGKAAESELVRRVSLAKGHDEVMPARGETLSRRDINTLRNWINQGAAWPENLQVAKHWSYVKPNRPALSTVRDPQSEIRNPIDSFVQARLEIEGLRASPPADPAALIRRVSFDLTGLPPTPAEVKAFLESYATHGADATYSDLVDRLLASPSFGERWARPWLDLARYADSHGFQRDDLREMWAYRDWVIAALNADLPFDQFTIEQIAGDLLPQATETQRIATGFHRCTTTNVEAGSEPEETRINQVLDRVNTTGAVWLGVTLECAQCHDHKYDPFTQRDYYQLLAFFNNTALEADRANPKVPGSIKFLGPTMPLTATILTSPKVAPPPPVDETQEVDENETTTAAARERRQSKKPAAKTAKPPTTLVMQELPEMRPSTIFQRGDYRSPGAAVQPDSPVVLHKMPAGDPNRLTLARWLVDRENPLTARVTVNRWWAELFGRGLVSTVEDFGIKGEPPTHPELLDWLAVEFMDSGWSMKHVLRTIVMSATYRQESKFQISDFKFEIEMNASPNPQSFDSDNIFLSRGPRFRLDAEAIRDNALAVSGLLERKLGGPPVRPYQPDGLWQKVGGEPLKYVTSPGADAYRRGLYVVWKRAAPYPSFVNFDATARLACTVKRSRSNTPLQSLTLLNDPVYVEVAEAFAARIVAEVPQGSLDERLSFAFRQCVARPPKPNELAILCDLFQQQKSAHRGHESAAWFAVASTLLNLDETITKN